jgi:predicted nucleic acid-binding protein
LPTISIITQIELLCWKTDDITLSKIETFINECEVLDISPRVIAECVQLRKKKKVKLLDAIIAATALANHLTLITRNAKDFDSIVGLTLASPFEL